MHIINTMKLHLITLTKHLNYNIFQHEIGVQDYTDCSSIFYFIDFHFSKCPICHLALPVGPWLVFSLVLALNTPVCHHLNMHFLQKYVIFQVLSFKFIFIWRNRTNPCQLFAVTWPQCVCVCVRR